MGLLGLGSSGAQRTFCVLGATESEATALTAATAHSAIGGRV